jgi:hypothetical protein
MRPRLAPSAARPVGICRGLWVAVVRRLKGTLPASVMPPDGMKTLYSQTTRCLVWRPDSGEMARQIWHRINEGETWTK